MYPKWNIRDAGNDNEPWKIQKIGFHWVKETKIDVWGTEVRTCVAGWVSEKRELCSKGAAEIWVPWSL